MTVRDELIARLAARLSRAEHVESISAEIPVADLRALIALATAPASDQSAEIARLLDVAKAAFLDILLEVGRSTRANKLAALALSQITPEGAK